MQRTRADAATMSSVSSALRCASRFEPASAATRHAPSLAGAPTDAATPAEPTVTPAIPLLAMARRAIASATGDRQVLPVQTKVMCMTRFDSVAARGQDGFERRWIRAGSLLSAFSVRPLPIAPPTAGWRGERQARDFTQL